MALQAHHSRRALPPGRMATRAAGVRIVQHTLRGLLILSSLLLPAQGAAQTAPADLLRAKTHARLRDILAGAQGVAGLSVADLATGEKFSINGATPFPQASAIKVPILMEVVRQAHEGKLQFAETRRIGRAGRVGGDGILQHFGDSLSHVSTFDLCVLMIVLSDNTATNLLIDRIGMESVTSMLRSLGLQATTLRRRMMDLQASAQGRENISTPDEAVRILELLYRGEFISREASDEVLSLLAKPKAGFVGSPLPEGTPIMFKEGEIPGVTIAWVLVPLGNRPYAFAVMESFGGGTEGTTLAAGISKVLYEYFSRLARATPHGTYVDPDLWR